MSFCHTLITIYVSDLDLSQFSRFPFYLVLHPSLYPSSTSPNTYTSAMAEIAISDDILAKAKGKVIVLTGEHTL